MMNKAHTWSKTYTVYSHVLCKGDAFTFCIYNKGVIGECSILNTGYMHM